MEMVLADILGQRSLLDFENAEVWASCGLPAVAYSVVPIGSAIAAWWLCA
jgi:hypothetical protein